MDRRLALTAAAAVPVLALIFFTLTRMMNPLLGYVLGLCCYWLFLAVMIWRNTTDTQRRAWLALRSPGTVLTALCIVPVLAVGMIGMAALGSLPTLVLIPIVVAAIVNGTLEELFWRGAILPRPDIVSAAQAVSLFTAWHLALLAAGGIVLTGGPFALLLGAGILGAIWMAARLRSGTLGAGVLSHIGVNIFAFIDLVARNTNFQTGLV